MKLQKASVRLTRGATYSGYRLTLYMGLNSDSGPSSPLLLESENDLYKYFNTFKGDTSFETARFCLKLGYKVYAQRVGYITGKSSCRKFIINGEDKYYSPLGIEYSESGFNFIEPEYVSGLDGVLDNSIYSAIISFPVYEGVYDNTEIDSKFLLIVPRVIRDMSTERLVTVYERLVGSGWTSEELKSFSGSPGHDTYLEPNLHYEDFEQTVINFFERKCSLEVVRVTSTSVYVQSQSPIQEFGIYNDYPNGTSGPDLITFETSDDGYQDNYCRKYDSYKVCTIRSKYENSLDDIEVVITKSLGDYLVDVYRYNSEKVVIYSETFSYGTSEKSPNFISNLSTDSDIVEIEVHDSSADLSGEYLLLGKEKVVTSTMYTDSIYEGNVSELSIDVIVDNSDSDQYNYIKTLKKNSNLSLLLTGYDFTDDNPDMFVKTCIVCPDVTWRSTGETLRGFTYLLYLLPNYSSGSDSSILRRSNLPEEYTENCTIIEKSDYSIDLMGASVSIVTKDSKFPIKSAISIISILNYISHSSCATVREFNSVLSGIVSDVNSYLGTNTIVTSENVSILNHTLSATLNFYVNKQIILSYRVSATLVV